MSWKTFVSDYLTFSKKDRIAILLFVGIMLFIFSAAYFSPESEPVALQEDAALSRLLDSATQSARQNQNSFTEPQGDAWQYRYELSKKPAFTPGAPFAFDPNTLDAEGWRKLGLPDRTIKTILNYRGKGGRFYRPEDLKKIWGLPDGFYEHVEDYITIAETGRDGESNIFKTPYPRERTIAVVDVNAADTTALIALAGIGSKLAQRIISFRDKLGGFHSTDQISETYGLPDSTFQKLKPHLQVHGVLKKFNINTATKDELKTHPYIKWNLANAIVEYRNQHGDFKKLDDLKQIMVLDADTYNKIVPYLSL